MKDSFNIKLNVYLLLTIIPVNMMGLYFAILHESLFSLYQWILAAIIFITMLFSAKNIVSNKSNVKWVAISIFVFLVQFSILALFLGPFTQYFMINLYYMISIISVIIFIKTIRRISEYTIIPIIFMVLTFIFTIYMMLINAFWG